MLPFQAYDALEEIGVLAPLRAEGIDIPPLRGGLPVSISVARQTVVETLREGLEILWEHELVDLLRDGDRVVGARLRTPEGERDEPADLVVGADGTGSRVRELAGIPADLRVADTAFVSFRSPVHAPEPFSIAFLSDGRQVTLLDWSGGSAGGWQIDRLPGGAEEALAPGHRRLPHGVPAPAAAGRGACSRRSPTTTSPTARSRRCAARSGGARASPWWASRSTR